MKKQNRLRINLIISQLYLIITIFNDLINKRKEIMSELHDSVDYDNLKFGYLVKLKI